MCKVEGSYSWFGDVAELRHSALCHDEFGEIIEPRHLVLWQKL